MFFLSVMIQNKLTINKTMSVYVLLDSRMTTNHTTFFIYTDYTGSDILLKTLCGSCVIRNCWGRTKTVHLRCDRSLNIQLFQFYELQIFPVCIGVCNNRAI